MAAIYQGVVDDRVLVLALSYCWCTVAHPDPEKRVLTDLIELYDYLDASLGSGVTLSS